MKFKNILLLSLFLSLLMISALVSHSIQAQQKAILTAQPLHP
ncbi:hypothetical protein [Spirosoma harenae]